MKGKEKKEAGETKLRKGYLKSRTIAEQTSIFLAMVIIFLSIMFATRNREVLLKQRILLGLGAALNISLSAEMSLRQRWLYAGLAVAAAIVAFLFLFYSLQPHG